MTDPKQHDEIRSFLRSGDPAASEPLDAMQVERMRLRILAESREDRERSHTPGRPVRAAIWAAAAVVVVIAAGIVWLGRPEPSADAPRTSPAASVGKSKVVPSDLRPARTIHFVTQSGTRVIWTFDPEFDLYGTHQPTRS